MTLPASVFAVLRVNPHPEEMICLRWKREDAESRAKAQQLLYPSSTYEVIEWFVH